MFYFTFAILFITVTPTWSKELAICDLWMLFSDKWILSVLQDEKSSLNHLFRNIYV